MVQPVGAMAGAVRARQPAAERGVLRYIFGQGIVDREFAVGLAVVSCSDSGDRHECGVGDRHEPRKGSSEIVAAEDLPALRLGQNTLRPLAVGGKRWWWQ